MVHRLHAKQTRLRINISAELHLPIHEPMHIVCFIPSCPLNPKSGSIRKVSLRTYIYIYIIQSSLAPPMVLLSPAGSTLWPRPAVGWVGGSMVPAHLGRTV